MTNKVSAVTLANVASEWLSAFMDVEFYCPPDDSDSWPKDCDDMFELRDKCEERFRELIYHANVYGIEDDV